MDTALKGSPLLWGTSLQPWSRILEFHYPVVEMKHLTPEDIKGWDRSVLLPLLPLTEGGAKWQIVQDMLYDLSFGACELLKIAFGMAMERMSEEERKRLKREYHMIYDELRADPLCREMLDDEREEGRHEGALQAAQQIAIRLVKNRFPELEKFASIVISAVSDVEQLQMFILELSIVSTPERAKQLLFSLASDS